MKGRWRERPLNVAKIDTVRTLHFVVLCYPRSTIGTFCAVGLFISADGDPLFLQVKEAGKSVLEFLGPKFSGHPDRRVVEGQHVMQASSDIFLGWSQDAASGRHFYVRELKNRRLGAISELIEENALVNYAITRTYADARSRARMRGRPIRPCLRATWARVACSTMRWRPSPWPMPIAHRATMTDSQNQSAGPARS